MSALAHDTFADARRPLAEELSRFALALRYEDIPVAVRERAKHLILDAVGIALASSKYPFALVSLAAMAELGTGTAPMNGILIHGLDFDDTHSRGIIHATASSFPCALALADRDEKDGKALLTAYVAARERSTLSE